MFRTDTPPRTRWENVNISNIPDTGSIAQLTVGRTISGKQTRPFILKPYWTWESLVIMTDTRHWHIPALLRYLPPWVFQHQVKVSSSRLEELGRRAASKQNRAHDLLMITQTGVSPGQPAWDWERRAGWIHAIKQARGTLTLWTTLIGAGIDTELRGNTIKQLKWKYTSVFLG